MTTITNGEELFRYAARARGRVVLITGQQDLTQAALGRRISLHFPVLMPPYL